MNPLVAVNVKILKSYSDLENFGINLIKRAQWITVRRYKQHFIQEMKAVRHAIYSKPKGIILLMNKF